MSSTIALTKMEQAELTQRATSQAGRADEARRARLILLLDCHAPPGRLFYRFV
jgi:hypothetical protein